MLIDELVVVSDDSVQSEEDKVAEIVAKKTQGKKGTSWVYQHAEKRQVKCATYFFCLFEINKTWIMMWSGLFFLIMIGFNSKSFAPFCSNLRS